MRIIIHPRSEGGVNVVEMRDSQFSADAKYSSTMETPNVITLEMEEGAERILLVVQNGDRSKWVIEENEIGDQWLSRRRSDLTPFDERLKELMMMPFAELRQIGRGYGIESCMPRQEIIDVIMESDFPGEADRLE